MKMRISFACLYGLVLACASAANASNVVPDNGGGTAHLPIHLDYFSQRPMHILDGLPPGTTVEIDAVLPAPTTTFEQPGGWLGGTQSTAIGSNFVWNMQGTGTLAGYSRLLAIPLADVVSFPTPAGATFELHASPRALGNPVQSFDTDMFRLFGQITGDPDFDLLRVVAGTDFGLPSPGHTTLTQAGSNWAVDSFFDITYRIDFVGRPGGQFAGQSGSTTGTVRLATDPVPEPLTFGLMAVGGGALVLCGVHRVRRRTRHHISQTGG